MDASCGNPFSYILIFKKGMSEKWSGFEPKISIREYRILTTQPSIFYSRT